MTMTLCKKMRLCKTTVAAVLACATSLELPAQSTDPLYQSKGDHERTYNDPVAPIDDSEVMAFLIKKEGVDTEFVRVPNGGHGDSWYTALPKIFDVYDAHPKRK